MNVLKPKSKEQIDKELNKLNPVHKFSTILTHEIKSRLSTYEDINESLEEDIQKIVNELDTKNLEVSVVVYKRNNRSCVKITISSIKYGIILGKILNVTFTY